jgi:hypothetical protein
MSKKTLLEEGSVRSFMKLANLKPLAEEFVSEMYKDKDKDDEEKMEEQEVSEEETVTEAEAEEVTTEAAESEDLKEEVVDEDVTEEVVSEEEMEMGAEEEMEMEEEPADGEELSITPEEAEILVKLGQKIAAAKTDEPEMEMAGEEEMEMAGDEEMAMDAEEEAPAMRDMYENLDDLVAEVSKRVKERLAANQE